MRAAHHFLSNVKCASHFGATSWGCWQVSLRSLWGAKNGFQVRPGCLCWQKTNPSRQTVYYLLSKEGSLCCSLQQCLDCTAITKCAADILILWPNSFNSLVHAVQREPSPFVEILLILLHASSWNIEDPLLWPNAVNILEKQWSML